MYRLYVGFRFLGEFDSIREAKQFAGKSGLSGTFNLIGVNYRDVWYVPTVKK
ncbi:MAG: hypothetical protein E6767_15095 [Dysgonomonas sp.]|nr:hypothetical protein [Dysgonomonas sp.]